MNKAAELANFLLENEQLRVCSACERESGIPPEPLTALSNKTHGTCKRHWLEQAAQAGMDQAWINAKAQEYEREGKFTPDTGKTGAHGRPQQPAQQQQQPAQPARPIAAPGTGY